MNQLPIFNRQDVVDLVKSFAGSGDLRLRANGIQALAVLVDGNEPQLAAMAEPELIDAIATAPSSADAEMMNRFRDRVLASLQELQAEQRRRVLDSLRERHEATRDRVRRNALGVLLLRAMGSGMAFQAGWRELRRLLKSTEVVKVLPVFGLCGIAVLVAFFVLAGISAAFKGNLTEGGDPGWLLPIGWLLLSGLIYYTTIGRLDVPMSVRVGDAAAWGGAFAILTACSAALLQSEGNLAEVAVMVAVGALVGIAIRLYRRESPSDWPWDALSGICIATFGCMVASYLEKDHALAGSAWLALAPAAGIAAALSNWFENKLPSVRPIDRKRAVTARSLVLAAFGAIILVGGMHVITTVSRFSTLLLEAEAEVTRDSSVPRSIDLSVREPGTYTIRVSPKAGHLDICLLVNNKFVNDAPKGKSEQTTVELPAGTHRIEISPAPSIGRGCGAPNISVVSHAAEFLAGFSGDGVTITISKSASAPAAPPSPTK